MVRESQDAIPVVYYANDRNALRVSLDEEFGEDPISRMQYMQRALRHWAQHSPQQPTPTINHAESAYYLMYSERSYALDAPLP